MSLLIDLLVFPIGDTPLAYAVRRNGVRRGLSCEYGNAHLGAGAKMFAFAGRRWYVVPSGGGLPRMPPECASIDPAEDIALVAKSHDVVLLLNFSRKAVAPPGRD